MSSERATLWLLFADVGCPPLNQCVMEATRTTSMEVLIHLIEVQLVKIFLH